MQDPIIIIYNINSLPQFLSPRALIFISHSCWENDLFITKRKSFQADEVLELKRVCFSSIPTLPSLFCPTYSWDELTRHIAHL